MAKKTAEKKYDLKTHISDLKEMPIQNKNSRNFTTAGYKQLVESSFLLASAS
jgi:hypothetical protein